ncbi:hypothetical protein SK128_007713, partial [Halocaridina rubra]
TVASRKDMERMTRQDVMEIMEDMPFSRSLQFLGQRSQALKDSTEHPGLSKNFAT